MLEKLQKLVELENRRLESNYYSTHLVDYSNFHIMFEEELLKSPDKEKNAKEFVDNLDIVLSYTSLNAMEWIQYDIVTKQSDFVNKLADNLKFYNRNESLKEVVFILIHLSRKLRNRLFNNYMIEKLLELKLPSQSYIALFKRMNNDERYSFLKMDLALKVPVDYSQVDLSKKEEKFISDNIITFASFSNNVLSLRKYVHNKKAYLMSLNDYINSNYKCVLDSLVSEITYKCRKCPELFMEVIDLLIRDIILNEECNLSDISISSNGFFSVVVRVGDKILKIGKSRMKYKFNNNPYIVKPLIRKNIEIDGTKFIIEVTEAADNNTKPVTEEELYSLYRKIRDIGLIWTDIKKENVGYLLKDNLVYWNKPLASTDDALGLDSYRGKDIFLKKGELVVIDADCFYDENDVNIYGTNIEYDWHDFERKYQNERKQFVKKRK